MKIGIQFVLVTAVLVAIDAGAARATPPSVGTTAPERTTSAPVSGAALPAVFHGDARIETKVTLAEKNRPLGELLTGLGEQIGVRLVASSETADDKVTLYLDDRPAAEALALVGRQFGFQWKKSHGGYELTQDLAASAREAALRESGRAGRIAAIEARMGRVAQIAPASGAQREARGSEIDRQLSDPSLSSEQQARLVEEQAALQDAGRPGAAAAAAVYGALTAAQLSLLRAGGEICLSTRDNSLAPPLAEAVRQAAAQQMQRDAERMTERMAGRPVDRGAGAPASAPAGGPGAGEANVSIRFSTTGFRKGPPRPGGPPLQLRFTLTSEQESGGRHRILPVMWWPMLPDPASPMAGKVVPAVGAFGKEMTPPAGDATTEAAGSDDPVLRREVELTFPGLKLPITRTNSAPAGGKGDFGAGRLPSEFFWPSDMPTLGDICEALHRATGLEVIADSFIRDRLDAAKVTGKHPLAQTLGAIADRLEYDWKKEGNLLRFRSRTYYQDRFAEVPDRILRPWLQRVGRTGAPVLDDLAELAAALNDDQCSGMQEFWGWYLEKSGIPMPPGPADFADKRQHLRLWASLSPVQKQAALAGTILPVAQMNGLQQRAFQAALTSPTEGPPDPTELRHSPSAAELAAGGFSLQSRQLRQQLATGTWPDGGQFISLTRRPAADPLDPSASTGPNGIPLQPLGPPSLLDSHEFTYYLGGDTTPARTTRIDVPGPQRQAPAPN